MYIFDEAKAVPLMATAQIQQWALTLSAYMYTIQYKAGKDHANAEGLSRLPMEDSPTEVPKPAEMILLMGHFAAFPVPATHTTVVWWPVMDGDLKERVKQCTLCQECRRNTPAAPLHPWKWPEQPWRRVHADYVGPFLGHVPNPH